VSHPYYAPDRDGRAITSRSEWLRDRLKNINASEVPTLFDKGRFLSRELLATVKRGEDVGGDSSVLRSGRIHEIGIGEVAVPEERPDWKIRKANTYHQIPSIRIGATPDYWIDDDGMMECKFVSPWEWERMHGHPSLSFFLQTLTGMLVTGRVRGVLAIMIGRADYPLYLYDVPRHPEAEARIVAAVKQWWREWPSIAEAQPADDIAAMLDDGSYRDLSGNNAVADALARRESLKEIAKATDASLKECEDVIKAALGPARTAWLPGWSLSYPTIHRDEHVVKASDYRRLTVKRSEG
jgi:predicted phage-related endonuclease